MSKTQIVNEIVNQVVDFETGEVKERSVSQGTRTIVTQEPSYVKLYIQDLLYMQDMPKGLTNIVYELVKYATFADKGLQVYLPIGLKKKIARELDTTPAYVSKSLTKLIQGGIIRRVDTGIYELNPWFFGKGEWKDIDKLRSTWSYDDIKGRTFEGLVAIRKNGTKEQTENDWAADEEAEQAACQG